MTQRYASFFISAIQDVCHPTEPIPFIIPHVNFQQSDWSIGRVTILNVTRQYLTALKFFVEMGHLV